MTTKKDLELKVTDLERDIQRLLAVLREIHSAASEVDYSPSPTLEQTPSYIVGRVRALAKFAPLDVTSVRFDDYLETLEKAAV